MKYILGNWKMNGGQKEAVTLARALTEQPLNGASEVAVFPPFIDISLTSEALYGSKIKFGAQDCSQQQESGAYTGEISAAMLKEYGCSYVIVGHSERRQRHGESNEMVKAKAIAAIKAGIKPVICVGENLEQRESCKYLEIISAQVKASLPFLDHSSEYLIAYEPVWAIGTGKVATILEIIEVHKTIASLLYHDTSMASKSVAKTAVLYGGSVKSSSAREIMSAEGVDGVLVGGASLDAAEFGKIIQGAG